MSALDPFWLPTAGTIPISTPLPFAPPSLPKYLSAILTSEVFARWFRTTIMLHRLYASLLLEFWIGIGIPFILLGHLGVLSDLWGKPYAWPPYLNGFSAISERGIRGFWGETWHQSMRYVRITIHSFFFRLGIDFIS